MRILPLPGVFRPRSDTWMLAAIVREHTRPGTRMLELCTGSGAIAIAAARAGGDATAVDVSRRAVLAVRANARLNGVRVRALRGDLLAPVAGQRFDLIAANPPYLPAEDDALPRRGRARHTEAGLDGRAVLDRLLAAAPAHLAPGGVLLVVHSALTGEDATLARLAAAGLQADVARRQHGGLGPLLSARAPVLEARGSSLRDGGRRTCSWSAGADLRSEPSGRGGAGAAPANWSPRRSKQCETATMSLDVVDREMSSEAEAARLLRVPRNTLHYWLEGERQRGKTHKPIACIEPRGGRGPVTWAEFIEAGLLRQYRREHGLPMAELRACVDGLCDRVY